MTTELSGTWRLYYSENEVSPPELLSAKTENEISALCPNRIPAQVPGNFELDLMREGLLPDLFFGDNTLLAHELEYTHLWYCRSFACEEVNGNEILRFDGIDTAAEIFLNGSPIGTSDNMFIPHEFPALSLRPGENELVVHISPAVLKARQRAAGAASESALPYNFDSLTVRKAAYMYGWDIMPRIVSGGIWKDVTLFTPAPDRIEELYIRTREASEDHASLRIYVRLSLSHDRINDYSLRINGSCGESHFSHERRLWHTEFTVGLGIASPRLWWPRNLGSPSLYDVTAELLYRGEVVFTQKLRTGIRTVRLERTSYTDSQGSGEFRFIVNGEPFFALGTNWVPTDAFPSRMKDRLSRDLELLWDSGCNMVRCWGGGVYEDDKFFDFCDEHGIAVWQDFMMGCAIYPQTAEFAAMLAAEAESVVKRLRGHASLFCWAGDNECDESWLWGGTLDPNKSIPTRLAIPYVLHLHDPWREYIPSSPYIDPEAFRAGKRNSLSEDHLWGPRDYYKGSYYTNSVAHFASETGYHGCPSPESVRRFISEDHLTPDPSDREWLVHASSMEADGRGPYDYRIKLMSDQVGVLFGSVPGDLESFALASQISQSEAKKFFIERFRIGKWRRTGILWWNLVDGWPQFSDAVTDWYGVKKLAYKTIRRVSAPVCGMFGEPQNGELPVVFANEFRSDVRLSFQVTDAQTHEVLLSREFECPANASAEVCRIPDSGGFRVLVIRWLCGGVQGVNHYVCGTPPYDLRLLSSLLKSEGLLDVSGFESV